jgi:hypothetical protein
LGTNAGDSSGRRVAQVFPASVGTNQANQ